MTHDPIVDEIRAFRERLAASFDFDLQRIIADAQSRQTASKARVVSFQKKPGTVQTAPPVPGGR